MPSAPRYFSTFARRTNPGTKAILAKELKFQRTGNTTRVDVKLIGIIFNFNIITAFKSYLRSKQKRHER